MAKTLEEIQKEISDIQSQMPGLTEKVKEVVSGYPDVSTVSSENIQPSTDTPFVSADETPVSPPPETTKTTDIKPTPQETEISTLIKELKVTSGLAGEKEAYRIEREKEAGIETMRQAEADYTAQLTQLQADWKNVENRMQLAAEGRGITAGGLAPLTMAEQRKISIRANTVSALLAATQGKITFAQSQVDRVIFAQFSQREADRQAKLDNLDLLLKDPSLTVEQKARAEAQAAKIKKEEVVESKKKDDAKTIMNWAVEAAKNGATPEQAQAIAKIAMSDNPDLQVAMALYAPFAAKKEEDKLLSVAEIKALNLPFGTTEKQAARLGITPVSVVKPLIEKPATVAQQTTAGYAVRMEQANPILKNQEGYISGMNWIKFKIISKLPSALQSSEFQQYDQAARNLINAILRRESGAAIAQSEFDNARKQYLPMPGDSEATLRQKEMNRNLVFANFKQGAGTAYSSIEELLGGGVSGVDESEVYTTPDGTEYIKGEDGLYYPK